MEDGHKTRCPGLADSTTPLACLIRLLDRNRTGPAKGGVVTPVIPIMHSNGSCASPAARSPVISRRIADPGCRAPQQARAPRPGATSAAHGFRSPWPGPGPAGGVHGPGRERKAKTGRPGLPGGAPFYQRHQERSAVCIVPDGGAAGRGDAGHAVQEAGRLAAGAGRWLDRPHRPVARLGEGPRAAGARPVVARTGRPWDGITWFGSGVPR